MEWDILGVPAERHEKFYPCCKEPYPGKVYFSVIISKHTETEIARVAHEFTKKSQ